MKTLHENTIGFRIISVHLFSDKTFHHCLPDTYSFAVCSVTLYAILTADTGKTDNLNCFFTYSVKVFTT